MLEEPTKTCEDGVNTGENNSSNMGATRNLNVARITALQQRKKEIEDILTKRNQELRQLCIQEAELTGITPPEMPLEPGETLPLIRRKIGTSYQLPEKLVKNANNKDETIADLELQIQLHANMAEAALGLANEQNVTKTMKRQHRTEYQKHKQKCLELQVKLAALKEKAATTEQHKQKKKPRVPEVVDDNVSMSTTTNEPYLKPEARHSMNSIKHNMPTLIDSGIDHRFSQDIQQQSYRLSEIPQGVLIKQDDPLSSGFYRLSLNGYSKYMERRENITTVYQSPGYNTHSNMFHYNFTHNPQILTHQYQQHSPHMSQNSPQIPQHSPHLPQHSPRMSQQSPRMSQHSPHMLQHSPHLPQHSPRMSQHSPILNQHSPHLSQHSSHYSHLSQSSSHSSQHSHHSMTQHSPRKTQQSPQPSQRLTQYTQYSHEYTDLGLGNHRQPSPTSSLAPKTHYYPSQLSRHNYRHYDEAFRSPHQIQPHQQYEQMNSATSGLGGCWKKTGNGEVWYPSNTVDANWQRDKRFGSLDRRKTKRVSSSRISPNIEHKSATISAVANYQGHVRSPVKTSKIINRRSQDNGQLVRTQSLGSVGAITVDSVYPTDDSSSYGSDNRVPEGSITLKKPKEKEWLETSLDGPITPVQPNLSTSQPLIPVYSPEEKPPLEIPAESNPVKIREPNIELFNNNNIPKNGTVVQAGHCKPYHEETKPFEMSDFYKYSTKFKKSPTKTDGDTAKVRQNLGNVNNQRNLNANFESGSQPAYSANCQLYNNNSSNLGSQESTANLNASLELDHLAVSEHFSDEMNAWFKDQRKNNNSSSPSKGRSTATLV